MDFPHNLGDMYMNQLHSVLYRLHLIHMGLVHMELAFLAPQELERSLRIKKCARNLVILEKRIRQVC
jgi:hypothetical protein